MRGLRALAAGVVTAGAASMVLDVRDRRAIRTDPRARELCPWSPEQVLEVRSPDGTRLHVQVAGKPDGPTVVLAHGWTCTSEFWTAVVHRLRATHRLVAYDLRGHGRSGPAAGRDWSTDALAADLQAVLEATVPSGRRATLVGHSMGAMSIVAWAHRHPDEVTARAAAAVLASTGVGALVGDSHVLRRLAPLGRLHRAAGRWWMCTPLPTGTRSTPLSRRAVRYVATAASASPAVVAFCERQILHTHRVARSGFGRTLSALDLSDGVAHLSVPTTVLVGDADRLTPPVHARRLAGQLPDLRRLSVLEGIGHMTPVEDPDTVAAAIRDLAGDRVGAS